MRRKLAQLRWQLTFSHLIAIAFTLISMIAAVVVIATTWWSQANAPEREPAQDARLVATTVGRMVLGGNTAELDLVLRALVQGTLRVAPQYGAWTDHGAVGMDLSQRNVAYIAIVGSDGRVLASSDPSGADFNPPEQPEWPAIVAPALDGGAT